MNCEEWNKLLGRRIAGDLDSAELVRLESHLQTCDACRTSAAQYEELAQGLKALRSAYADVQPPFVFGPAGAPPASNLLRRRLFVIANASLATAAAVMVLLTAVPPRGAHDTKEGSAALVPIPGTPSNLRDKLPRVLAPPLWPGSARSCPVAVGTDVRFFPRGGPLRLGQESQAATRGRLVRFQIPTVILKKRRSSDVEDGKQRDDRSSVGPGWLSGDGCRGTTA